MDTVSRVVRSRNMRAIKSENTSPEMKVRSHLHRNGLRFGLHCKDLPGKPDIVLRRHKKIVMVHGCFWHQHSRCKYAAIPKTNKKFWNKKLLLNIKRDYNNVRALKKIGYDVATVWECQIRKGRLYQLDRIIKAVRQGIHD